MPPLRPRLALATGLAVASAGIALSACGTSIRGMYESDVRFEHCMALDAELDPKPGAERACWEEWTRFYTFGQTRDRIEYAQRRMSETGAANAPIDAGPKEVAAVPDPTSAYAPPPSMLATPDAGAAPIASASASPSDGPCATTCDLGRETCRARCKGPACEATCASREARCRATCARSRSPR